MFFRAFALVLWSVVLLAASEHRLVAPGFEVDFKVALPASLGEAAPRAVAWLPEDRWVITDEAGHRLLQWDRQESRVSRLAGGPTHGDRNGLPFSARFALPQGVALLPGGVAIADAGNHKIRFLAHEGNVSTLAGTGERGYLDESGHKALFASPLGVAASPEGRLYVADTFNHRIRVIEPDGRVVTLAGDGQMGLADGVGQSARFAGPSAIALSPQGQLYVADTYNHAVRVIEPDGRVWTLAGRGYSGYRDGAQPLFSHPLGLAYHPEGFLLVADSRNHAIRMVQRDGSAYTAAGGTRPGDRIGRGDRARFDEPVDLAVDGAGDVLVVDAKNHTLKLLRYRPE